MFLQLAVKLTLVDRNLRRSAVSRSDGEGYHHRGDLFQLVYYERRPVEELQARRALVGKVGKWVRVIANERDSRHVNGLVIASP